MMREELNIHWSILYANMKQKEMGSKVKRKVNGQAHLTIEQVAELLGHVKKRKAKTWLDERGVSMTRVGASKLYLEWDIQFQFMLDLAKGLKAKYPYRWSDVFKSACKDESICEAVLVVLPPTSLNKRKGSNEQKDFLE